MNHKTDMQAALQACVDVLLHDGVLTDPEHPKRIALDAAEAILASRPDAQADERGAFEAWVKSEYGYSTERYELGGYKRPELNMWWTTWQARAAAPQAEAAHGVPDGWRELCRRLYVELFHCDQQMRSTRDQDGEPHWTQSAAVRDVLKDAKAALAAPSPDREQVGEAGKRFRCAARKQGTAGGNYPAECDWPMCGCDEHATRVIEALQESGHLRDASPSREHGEQDCPHGVADGACKQCYGEATFPRGFKVKHIEGHGWIIDPPSGTRWIAHEGTPAGELMQALAASASTLSEQPQAAEPKQTPFDNCQFRICDLPGQCRAEGKCHHPAAQAAEPKGLYFKRSPFRGGWTTFNIRDEDADEAERRLLAKGE